MLIYGLVLPATLLRFRIYGRVLTFRRSSDLSTGFGMYHNKTVNGIWRKTGPAIVADFQGFKEVINAKQKS